MLRNKGAHIHLNFNMGNQVTYVEKLESKWGPFLKP